jgi:hypothetical protein
MLPLYAARIEDLGLGDLVKVDCAACHHVALLTPEGLRRCARAASLRPRTSIRGRRGYSDHLSEADPANGAASMRSSFLTPRWREVDSNPRSR